MRAAVITTALFLFPLVVLPQLTVLWEEDFSLPDNTTSDGGPTAWSSQCIGCTFLDPNDHFHVEDNAFEGRQFSGVGVWTSESIDISNYRGVFLSAQLMDNGDLDATDSIALYYKLDNGPYTLFTNGFQSDDFGSVTATTGVLRGDSVRILMRMGMSSNNNNELMALDDVTVSALPEEAGPGYALDFDNNDDVIELPTAFPEMGGDDFSVCAWIRSNDVSEQGQRIFCDDENNGNGCYAFSLGDGGSGQLRFYIRGITPVILDVTNSAYFITSNTWYHVAIVHDGTAKTREIYVNGVLAASDTYTGTMPDCAGIAALGGETSSSSEAGNRFDGRLDEISYWSTPLSQTQIRNLMCQKLRSTEAGLLGYWPFDEGTGTTARDYTDNAYHGTLVNMASNDWVTSGSHLGDTSVYLYTGSWAGQSIFLQSSDGDSLQVSNVSGSPDGMFIYCEEGLPNTLNGTSGVGNNEHYFGVFKAFGTSPTYTAIYHYRENAGITQGLDEGDLMVYIRDDNTNTAWNAGPGTVDTAAKTITLAGQNTEFILGHTTMALPIALKTFRAYAVDDRVNITWTTLSETDNDYFVIERSSDQKVFRPVMTVDGAGTSLRAIEYLESDHEPLEGWSYYRLRQVDFDGGYSHSQTETVYFNPGKTSGHLLVYPNPLKRGETLQSQLSGLNNTETLLVLRGMNGKRFFTKTVLNVNGNAVITIPTGTLPPGVYVITASSRHGLESRKVMVH